MQTYYQSCVEDRNTEEGELAAVLDKLAEIGGWPLYTDSTWRPESFKWNEYIAKLGADGYNYEFFFTVYQNIIVDTYLMELQSPALGISNSFLRRGLNYKAVSSYFNRTKAAILDLFPELSTAENGDLPEYTEKEIEDIISFEVSLAKLIADDASFDWEAYVNMSENNNVTFKDLNDYADWGFKWNEMLSAAFGGETVFTESMPVMLDWTALGSDLFNLLEKTPPRTLANFIGWSVVKNSLKYLGNKGRRVLKALSDANPGKKKEPEDPIWYACMKTVGLGSFNPYDTFQILAAHLLATHYFPESSRETLGEMMVDMKHSMRQLIEQAEWMDFETRFNALDKLDAMKVVPGYPLELLSTDRILDLYGGIKLQVC